MNEPLKIVEVEVPPEPPDYAIRIGEALMVADGIPRKIEMETRGLQEKVNDEVEAVLIWAVLNETRFNQSASARILGLSRNTLRKRMTKYGMMNNE